MVSLIDELLEQNDGILPNLSEIGRDDNAGIIRGVGRCIGSE